MNSTEKSFLRSVINNLFFPTKLDEQFSKKVFTAYLRNLDPFKWFLTKEDIEQMEVYKLRIGEHIQRDNHLLYKLAVKLIDSRIIEVQKYYKEILSHSFDFTINETCELDLDRRDWPPNCIELKENWRKQLKMQTLYCVVDALKAQENETDLSKIKTIEIIEDEARERILKKFNYMFMGNLVQQKLEEKFSLYMNAILTVLDPHTIYDTPKDSEDCDIRLSAQCEGIGVQLTQSGGYARVVSLAPCSPSWLQGELKVNDLITKVKQEHEEETVDIFGMSLDNIIRLIRGKKGTKVTLTVKRVNGSIHEITIIRDVAIDEEICAKSAIVTDSVTKAKVGYIDLPSFYSNFTRIEAGRASSEDVATEIEKLKKEGIQGIILNLRSNSGGSIADAIKIAELFINSGPILQIRSNSCQPLIYQAPNSEVQYDGSLVILVSSISASASEIIAAALQDYKRAVIVGGAHTFGKGSAQMSIKIDEILPSNMDSLKLSGTLWLTMQKYYRINGESVQFKGIKSDIVLPSLSDVGNVGVRYKDNYPLSSVPPAKFEAWKNPVPVEMLRRKSNERASKNERFILLNRQIAFFKRQHTNNRISLNLKTYQQEQKKQREVSNRFEMISKQITSLSIAATSHDIAEMNGDTVKSTCYERWIKELSMDIFLEEAVRVILDMRQ